MKNKLLSAFVVTLSALVIAIFPCHCQDSTNADAATFSQAECVAEVTSRRFLNKRNAESDLPMSSTTKVLTAILILDDCDITETVTVPKVAEGTEGSSVYLRAGDEYTVEELLYGLMLRSGNDCAVTLALHHSGSIKAFAQAMNEKAVSLGAEHSNFVNPHGLPDTRHYTTAQDLALISAYAMQNEKFREIVSCKYYEPRNWQNKNKMLYNYDGAIGVKTGFTVAAGRCLVTAAERYGMTLVCVVLNSPQMYERTAELLDQAFAQYEMTQLCTPETPVEGYAVKYAFSYPLTDEERDKIQIDINEVSPLPEEIGEIAGQMRIMLENNLLFSQNLYMMKK
ncbi:MAG: D-alanyl-D-alanine carboxypeptidase [Clostridia bacterium]|nr:D-alanyl-D-alanine carboxypeptidase [Clostridia bacterium]